jgi:hypothetical protein
MAEESHDPRLGRDCLEGLRVCEQPRPSTRRAPHTERHKRVLEPIARRCHRPRGGNASRATRIMLASGAKRKLYDGAGSALGTDTVSWRSPPHDAFGFRSRGPSRRPAFGSRDAWNGRFPRAPTEHRGTPACAGRSESAGAAVARTPSSSHPAVMVSPVQAPASLKGRSPKRIGRACNSSSKRASRREFRFAPKARVRSDSGDTPGFRRGCRGSVRPSCLTEASSNPGGSV